MSENVSIEGVIKNIVKSGKVSIGYRTTVKNIKLGKAKAVIMASKIPRSIFDDIKYYSSLGGIPVLIYDGTSMDLGAIIGKPFPVSSIAVIDLGNVSLDTIRELASKSMGGE